MPNIARSRAIAGGRDQQLGIVILPQPGVRGGGRQIAQERDALIELRLQIGERIEVVAASHPRDLRAQLFSFRRATFAPDVAFEIAVELFEEFLLIGTQRLHRGRIDMRDRVLPRGRKPAIGRGNPDIRAGCEFPRGRCRAAIKRGLGGGKPRRERWQEQKEES